MSNQESIQNLKKYVEQHIIGQEKLVDRMLIALLADGHLLVEGAPGLAKTTAIKVLAERIEGDFHRIQFTPDLLPSDLVGTDIYRHEKGAFEFRPGPLFHNILLADEINRAPAKVQSALLEVMEEHQVTVDGSPRSVPDPEPDPEHGRGRIYLVRHDSDRDAARPLREKLEDLGFNVERQEVAAQRNPPWAREELVLALELYLAEGQLDDTDDAVIDRCGY